MSIFISLIGITISIGLLIRNKLVYNYRKYLLGLVSKASEKDIKQRKDWEWRFKELEKVNYYRMVYLFWKPLSSFWDDYSFTESEER